MKIDRGSVGGLAVAPLSSSFSAPCPRAAAPPPPGPVSPRLARARRPRAASGVSPCRGWGAGRLTGPPLGFFGLTLPPSAVSWARRLPARGPPGVGRVRLLLLGPSPVSFLVRPASGSRGGSAVPVWRAASWAAPGGGAGVSAAGGSGPSVGAVGSARRCRPGPPPVPRGLASWLRRGSRWPAGGSVGPPGGGGARLRGSHLARTRARCRSTAEALGRARRSVPVVAGARRASGSASRRGGRGARLASLRPRSAAGCDLWARLAQASPLPGSSWVRGRRRPGSLPRRLAPPRLGLGLRRSFLAVAAGLRSSPCASLLRGTSCWPPGPGVPSRLRAGRAVRPITAPGRLPARAGAAGRGPVRLSAAHARAKDVRGVTGAARAAASAGPPRHLHASPAPRIAQTWRTIRSKPLSPHKTQRSRYQSPYPAGDAYFQVRRSSRKPKRRFRRRPNF